MTRDPLFAEIAILWRNADPLPEGMIARMQAVALAEAALSATDLDYELMLLAERMDELAGARSATTSYNLRFTAGATEMLVRVAEAGSGGSRVDGWIVPPSPVTVRLVEVGGKSREYPASVDDFGRFELAEVPAGLYRLWLHPADGEKPFVTPTFEV